jgi:hypothetical protein
MLVRDSELPGIFLRERLIVDLFVSGDGDF